MQDSAEQEVAKRTAIHGAGLAAAAKAVGLEDHRQLLREHRERVRTSYKDQRTALGLFNKETDMPTEEDMGDINVSGDHVNHHYHYNQPSQQPSSAPAPSSPQPASSQDSLLKKYGIPLITAGATAAGILGYDYLTSPRENETPPAETTTVDPNGYQLRFAEPKPKQ